MMSFLDIVTVITLAIYILAFAFFRLEPRASIVVALVILSVTPVTVIMGREELGDQLAIYAFYLLAAGVILLLIQKIRKGSSGNTTVTRGKNH